MQRLLAWVRAHTLRFRPGVGRDSGRCPYCIDDNGRELSLVDMANDLGWRLPNASREWKSAELQGLVRRQGKRLYLVGEVPKMARANNTGNVICTDNVSPFIQHILKGWPKLHRNAFLKVWEPAVELGNRLIAHQLATARDVVAEMQDRILTEYGVERKHLPKRRAVAAVDIPELLKPFVAGLAAAPRLSVQTPDCTDNKSRSEQITSSLLNRETPEKRAQPSSSSLEVLELTRTFLFDDAAARQLLAAARQHNPNITVPELVLLCKRKYEQVRGSARNVHALLISSVPKMCQGALYEWAHRQASQDAAAAELAAAELARLSGEVDQGNVGE